MNTTVIVLGVILILVIVYMVFQDYFTGTTSLKEQTNLKSGVQTQSGLKLGSPESKNVTYSVHTAYEKCVMYRMETRDRVLRAEKLPLGQPAQGGLRRDCPKCILVS